MSTIRTSYFGKLRSLDPSLYFLVHVCARPPEGVRADAVLLPALPGWQRLVRPYKEGLIDEKEYERLYMRQLDSRREDILAAVRDIAGRAGDRIPLLLCYEKPPAWCHRHILARWLRNEGFDTGEL